MIRLIKAKKGVGADDFIPLLFLMIAGVFFIFIFAIFQAGEIKAAKTEINGVYRLLDGQQELLGFLQSSAPGQKGETNMADFLITSYIDNDYVLFEREAKTYFNTLYGDNGLWWLKVQQKNGVGVLSFYSERTSLAHDPNPFALAGFVSLPIPYLEDTSFITVTLFRPTPR
jgi:hypothetical protein